MPNKPQSQLVGILNLTPDSFSGDGVAGSHKAALKYAEQLLVDGADWIDVGAESTRPSATPLDADEEWQRLKGSLEEIIQLVHSVGKKVSLDTYHPQTAHQALELGVDAINDVTGFTAPQMIDAIKPYDSLLIVMHSLTVPADPTKVIALDQDPAITLREFFVERCQTLQSYGIKKQRLILDAGIGFGKNAWQSWQLLLYPERWQLEDYPQYVGHSRKSFFSLFSDASAKERDGLTRMLSASLIQHGVDYLRVHDIEGHVALRSDIYANIPQ